MNTGLYYTFFVHQRIMCIMLTYPGKITGQYFRQASNDIDVDSLLRILQRRFCFHMQKVRGIVPPPLPPAETSAL